MGSLLLKLHERISSVTVAFDTTDAAMLRLHLSSRDICTYFVQWVAITDDVNLKTKMGSHVWIIGMTLSLAATLFGTLGKVLLKLSHTSPQAVSVKVAATVCVFLLNPVFDAMSYAYAAQSILAPMAGFSVVWNIVLSPYLLHETLSANDVTGSAVILVGCILVGISGSHDTPTHHSAELFGLFQSRIFVEYAIFVVCIAVVLAWVICSYSTQSGWRRFAFGALSGLIGGNLFFLKASVELLAEGGAIWFNPETYVIFVAALSSAGGGIYVLDQGLRENEFMVATCRLSLQHRHNGEILPLITSLNDEVANGSNHGSIEVV
ncbi:unnamed protein product [Peronospora belbahrii]|uniref:EamA domain-containing protein n=1 Tax=Peronospora belbahrii TaxID=622444 RepID=A0ABN8CRP1_9STRA|nr:unnamed protein product [Peronospora belbahrii]